MAFIKKTVVVTTRETTQTIKTVQCPYCKVHLEPVPKYVTAMVCWKCSKEFRIEVDPDKIVAPELPSVTGTANNDDGARLNGMDRRDG